MQVPHINRRYFIGAGLSIAAIMIGLLITQSGWTLTDTGACASPADSSVEITSSTSVSPVVTGEKGETGPTGPKGEPGITGGAGLAGSDGVTGATDEPDETEDTVVGKTDDTVAAITEDTGPTQDTIDAGITEDTSDLSATEDTVDLVLSEEDEACPDSETAIEGPEGPEGPTGPEGPIGATGPIGPIGATGSPGTQLTIGTQSGHLTPRAVLNLKKQLFVFNDGEWTLPDATDGAIVYFIMGPTGILNAINIYVSHLRVVTAGVTAIQINQLWQPFALNGATSTVSLVSAVFTNGAWSVSGGSTT
jgi:hypothetical protein